MSDAVHATDPSHPEQPPAAAAPDPLSDAAVADWLRLAQTPHVGPVAAGALLGALGDPAAIFNAGREQLLAILAGCHLPSAGAAADALAHPPQQALDARERLLAVTLAWRAHPGNALLTLHCPDYPPQLREIANPPPLLYIKGRRELLRQPALAIVGSRNASAQGVANAERFAAALSAQGVAIVSGLALGIDAAAHRGGLAGRGATVAVTGTGADKIYPRSNHALALRIAAEGCIVTEYPLGTPAQASHFPRRNRVISGLARGVLVVEAAAESGSLITARRAAEQGRDVYAIPGSIHSALSKGCHQLIREGAKLVETAEHLLEEILPGAAMAHAAVQDAVTLQLKAELETLLLALGHDPAGVDALALRSGLPAAEVQAHLLALELAGLIERLPDGIYQRIAR